MIPVCVLVEVLAIVGLIVGVPVAVAGTAALLAATPASAVAIWRILKTDRTLNEVVDAGFFLFTWTSLPCLLALHATDGVGENVFRFIIAARVFAAVSLWRAVPEASQAIVVTSWCERHLARRNRCSDGDRLGELLVSIRTINPRSGLRDEYVFLWRALGRDSIGY